MNFIFYDRESTELSQYGSISNNHIATPKWVIILNISLLHSNFNGESIEEKLRLISQLAYSLLLNHL